MNILEAERCKWSRLWKAEAGVAPMSWEHKKVERLPPLVARDLKQAARLFRTGTSNIKGVGPRHIGLPSDDAL